MKDSLNSGKGFLKEKMGGYQVDPPASVWSSISGRVGSRRRRGLVISLVAAAASVALAITLGINYFAQDLPESSGMAESTQHDTEVTSSPDRSDYSSNTESHPDDAEYHAVETEPPADAARSQRTARRETLEEKVVQAMGDVAEMEAFPYETGTPSISEVIKSNQPLQAGLPDGEVFQTEVSMGEESKEDAAFQIEKELMETQVEGSHPEKLTLDADVPLTDDDALEAELAAAMNTPMDFNETAGRDPRWVIGAALSPLYSFRDAEPEIASATTGYESGMISYAGGVHVGYRTTRRLAIETGVFFNKMGLDIDASGIQMYSNALDLAPIAQDRAYAGSMNVMAASNTIGNIVSQSGDVYVNQYKLNASSADNKGVEYFNTQVPAGQGIRQHLDYIEVPLNLRYTLVDRSIEFQLIGGVSTNILVNNYVTMEGVDGETEIGYLSNIRNVNYSGNAGVGLIYHLLDHLSLSVEPRFRYFLHSVNDATLPSTRPYTFGLYTGINYLF